MKKLLLSVIYFIIDIYFLIKIYKAKKMQEFDEKFNNVELEEVKVTADETADATDNFTEQTEQLTEPLLQEEPKKRGRRATELKAYGGKVYRIEIETGLVQEIDGVRIPKSERKPFSHYTIGSPSFFEEPEKSEGAPLDIPADIILNLAIMPINNMIASQTKDEDVLKVGSGGNPERTQAANDLAVILSRYIKEKTRVADPNEVILLTSAALFAAPLAISYSTNKKES